MKLFIPLLFLLILTLISNKTNAQLSASIEVNIKDVDLSNLQFMQIYPLAVNIEQIINLEKYESDSINLFLKKGDRNNIALYRSLFFQDFSVSKVVKDSIYDCKFNFNGNILTIKSLSENSKIIIKYRYQSDFIIKHISSTASYLIPFMSSWHSWYFTNPNISIENFKISIPKSQFFYCDNPATNVNSVYSINGKELKEELSFYLINKNYYQKLLFAEKGETEVSIFLNKGISIDTIRNIFKKDSIIVSPSTRVDSFLISKVTNEVKRTVKNLDIIFPYASPKHINIIDGTLQLPLDDNENLKWGNKTEMNEGDFYILIDTSFWNDNSIQHELIHVYNEIIPEKEDTSYYFFAESMVEYLSVILKYEYNDKKIKDVFEEKHKKYIEKIESVNQYSIFSLSNNSANLHDGRGSNSIIYLETPYLIYEFANTVGFANFMLYLYEFYNYTNAKSAMNFEDFEIIMKKNGIAEKELNKFKNDL